MEFDFILQRVLEIAVEVLLPIVLALLAAWLRAKFEQVKAQIPAEQYAFAASLARQLVLAAEQNGLKEELLRTGQAKKEWVLIRLDGELRKQGIRLDLLVLSDMIESAVYGAFKSPNP